MALRLLHIVVPTTRLNKLEQLLDDAHSIDSWRIAIDDEYALTGVLLDSSDVEPLTDALNEEYRHNERFRMTLLPVEATTPKVEQQEKSKPNTELNSWASRLGRVSREELLDDIEDGTRANALFVIMTLLSTLVACVGLDKGSAAIIIGAMVIAPLLGPNMALALGATLGDLDIMRKSIIANLVGLAIALLISVVFGLVLISGELNDEITARTSIDLSDILLGLASGAAGAIALTSGVSGALVGVMVAVALLPPTAACGMLLGIGEFNMAGRAATLTLTNVACINLSATGVFLYQGIRPNSWWEAERAKRATKRAVVIWSVALVVLAVLIVFAWTE